MDLPLPECSPAGGADLSPPDPAEDELIKHLMHGPTGTPAICRYCLAEIVEMPGKHYRLAAADPSVDRIRCKTSPCEEKRHLPQEPNPFCLDCGHEVSRGLSGDWESQESGTVCFKGGKHRVEQVIPNPGAAS